MISKNKVLPYTLTCILLTGNILIMQPSNVRAAQVQPNLITQTSAITSNQFDSQLRNLSVYLNQNIGNITVENLQNKLKDPSFASALVQWQFITQNGTSALDTFAKKDADHQNFLTWIMGNTDIMNTFLAGGIPTGNNSVNALEIWEKIWKSDKDSQQGFYLKLAIATSLAHAEPVICWNTNTPIDPVVRYNHYKTLDKNGKLLPCFDTYDVTHLRMVVNSWSSESDIDWAQNLIRTKYPQYLSQDKIENSAYLVPYVGTNKDGVSIQDGNDKFYGKGWNLNSILTNGGVCGNISKFGTQVCQAFGVTAMPTGQPGHCAFVWNDKQSSWSLGNNISGWGLSNHHPGTVIPWSDDKLSNQEPYLLLIEDASTNPQALVQSEQLRWLANSISSTTTATAVRDIAIGIQPLNIFVWKDKIASMSANHNTTKDQWKSLNKGILTAFAQEPRPMMDLLDSIRNNVISTSDRSSLQQYIIDMNNALNSVTDARQKQVVTEVKNDMLSKGLTLATFSFDGTNAGKLMGIKTDTEYSIDGGKTYKVAKSNDMALSKSELSSINSDNGILVRIVGNTQPILIPVSKSILNSVSGNDAENLVFGLDNTMEFSIDNGTTWTRYNGSNLPGLTGNVVLSVRKSATGTTTASDVVKVTFTNAVVKGLILHSKMSVVNVTSQQDNTGQAGKNAIDGNSTTFWHTKWDLSDKIPSITIKLDKTYNIAQLSYLPRQDGGVNGNVTAYNIYTSTDGIKFTKVASGNWADNNALKNVKFPSVNAQYVKFEVTKGHGGFASVSEINLYEN